MQIHPSNPTASSLTFNLLGWQYFLTWFISSCTRPTLLQTCWTIAVSIASNAGCMLYTNLDKFGANHESRIVYTRVICIRFVPWFAIRQFATTSSFCTNNQGTRTWFALICLWCVYLYTLFMQFGGFLVYLEVSQLKLAD